MELSDDLVKAEVYHQQNGVSFVKVNILGIYITSISVKESPNFPEKGLWVQLPKFQKAPGKWDSHVQRNPNGKLWKLIERKCQEAVGQYEKPAEDIFKDIFEDQLTEAIDNL